MLVEVSGENIALQERTGAKIAHFLTILYHLTLKIAFLDFKLSSKKLSAYLVTSAVKFRATVRFNKLPFNSGVCRENRLL